MNVSQGALFRRALVAERPLQIIGTVNVYCAMMAERVGYAAIYLSGGACANFSYGLPDLGLTSLDDVLVDVKRISARCRVPLLVDIDTGWEETDGISHSIQEMIKAGAAAVHMEDQVSLKRCGHRPNKTLVSRDHMVNRIKTAVAARRDPDFFILARTDALASEGMTAAIDRACAYVAAGADGIFAEALTTLEEYQLFCSKVDVPVLANITEFGQTPLFTVDELRGVGVQMVLYPVTVTRAMNASALAVQQAVREHGTQQSVVSMMQTREAMYDFLDYHQQEEKADDLQKKED